MHSRGHSRRSNIAKSTVAFLVFNNGLKNMRAAKIREKRFGHKDLRVGDLPKQEIRDPHFPARADQKVNVRQARGVKMGAPVPESRPRPDPAGSAAAAGNPETISARPP